MAGMVGQAFGQRPSDVLALTEAEPTWRLHFDFAVLHNLKTLESNAQARNPEAEAAKLKSEEMGHILEKKYGRAQDADEVARMLRAE